jgi:hypothetical protein
MKPPNLLNQQPNLLLKPPNLLNQQPNLQQTILQRQ